MEIEKVSGDYRPLILVAEDDDSNFKLINYRQEMRDTMGKEW